MSGRQPGEATREYSLPRNTVYKWVGKYGGAGSFQDRDNRSAEENELIALRKEVRQLRMENDLLKQAALILGRK